MSVDLAALLERTWSRIAGMIRPATPAALFRRADRYRNEGRYEEAVQLVAQGLRQIPDSSVGHLLSGYLCEAAREMDVTRADGTLVLARTDEERGRHLAQHLTQVYRMASATLSRAGLGPVRRGAIEAGSQMTFLLSDAGLVLSATLDGHVEVSAGLAQIGRLWTELGVKA